MNKPALLDKLQMPDAFAGWEPVYGTVQGWNGGFEILPQLVAELRPTLVIEVGAWLGLSTLVLARSLKINHLESAVLTVDTWLGSLEHWRDEKDSLELQHGYPTLYGRFLHNIASRGCADNVVPLPLPSAIAARLLREYGISAELIFVDGSHDEKDVYDDLVGYSALLAPGGVMCGDDLQWEGVERSVRRFAAEGGYALETTPAEETTYWKLRKQNL
jgi:hypothetical protein